jgi:HEAT repeat protein
MLWLTLKQLNSSNEDVRISAIDKLSKAKNLKALQPLITILNDKSKAVQMAAAIALGQFGDQSALEPLSKLFDECNDRNLQGKLIFNVFPLFGAPGIRVLESKLKNESSKMRISINNENFNNVKDIAQALEEFRDPQSITPLIEAMACRRDSAFESILSALRAIDGAWGDSQSALEAIPSLLSIIQSNLYWVINRNATRALGYINNIKSIETLIMLAQDKNVATYVDSALDKLFYNMKRKIPIDMLNSLSNLKPIDVLVNYENSETGEKTTGKSTVDFAEIIKQVQEEISRRGSK